MGETIHITALSNGPNAIGRLSTGKTVFVEGGVPGDVAEVEVTQEQERFCKARIATLVEPSAQRVLPLQDPLAASGVAPWAQVAYPTQLQAKRANVVAQLTHIAKMPTEQAEALVQPCVPSENEHTYRNKLELNVESNTQGKLQLGVHEAESHKLVSFDTYPLVHQEIAAMPKALQGALRYLQGSQDLGLMRVGIRHSNRAGACEIALWTTPGPFPRKAVATTLASAVNATSIVRVMANPGKARVVKGVEQLAGKGFWEEELAGETFKVSAPSFFQVNTAQAEKLVALVTEGLQLQANATAADLYCGVGTFTLPLARLATGVFAVEASKSAVRDLRRNAEDLLERITVIGGDSARELQSLGKLDALVVDPPRAGLAKGVAEDIAAANPARLAYVSCDPATLARDIARLQNAGYEPTEITPVDLFPQTHHVECVALFSPRAAG